MSRARLPDPTRWPLRGDDFMMWCRTNTHTQCLGISSLLSETLLLQTILKSRDPQKEAWAQTSYSTEVLRPGTLWARRLAHFFLFFWSVMCYVYLDEFRQGQAVRSRTPRSRTSCLHLGMPQALLVVLKGSLPSKADTNDDHGIRHYFYGKSGHVAWQNAVTRCHEFKERNTSNSIEHWHIKPRNSGGSPCQFRNVELWGWAQHVISRQGRCNANAKHVIESNWVILHVQRSAHDNLSPYNPTRPMSVGEKVAT